jgi:enoyl-CoA hydratase
MQTHISLETQTDIAYLTFSCDEPGKPATLDLQVLGELEQALDGILAQAGQLRAVIVRSDAPKYFVVGANVNALETLGAEAIVSWIQKGHAAFGRLEGLPLPVIARVEGYALGGGLELAMACDLILATTNARLGQPEANLGFVAGWGGTYRLPRRVGIARAKEMFFTGRILDAPEAYALGLVDFCGEPDELDEHLDALLESIRRCSPVAISQMKALVNNSLNITAQEACSAETTASGICMTEGDTKARVSAFLESRRRRKGVG